MTKTNAKTNLQEMNAHDNISVDDILNDNFNHKRKKVQLIEEYRLTEDETKNMDMDTNIEAKNSSIINNNNFIDKAIELRSYIKKKVNKTLEDNHSNYVIQKVLTPTGLELGNESDKIIRLELRHPESIADSFNKSPDVIVNGENVTEIEGGIPARNESLPVFKDTVEVRILNGGKTLNNENDQSDSNFDIAVTADAGNEVSLYHP